MGRVISGDGRWKITRLSKSFIKDKVDSDLVGKIKKNVAEIYRI